ncbi:uncharacterized protein LOC116339344 [Contarinia nasturtii]|uniref:uncharacterized protein LOC116339344 n=1 Tax=Contarinia nasturtii TaxID=265458 RepID=UPI0012D42A45|nr:uncharacterized protein LOC116339344 [Contarinia nasturtii]
MAHYTNPAFESEFCPRMSSLTSIEANSEINLPRSEILHLAQRRNWTNRPRNFQGTNQRIQKVQQRSLPPKPGPKPNHYDFHIGSKEQLSKCHNTSMQFNTSGYALVPLEDLPSSSKDRYAILPTTELNMMRSSSSLRLTKSQDNLDFVHDEEDSFISLPAIQEPQENEKKLISAFSSDFINKSMILVDQNSQQRYTIVPTDDDEEVVDTNHEIIEMHNGRLHRYAVIPTDDDDENGIINHVTNVHSNVHHQNSPLKMCTNKQRLTTVAEKQQQQPKIQSTLASREHLNTTMEYNESRENQMRTNYQSLKSLNYMPRTPTKNPIATQKLHELLSTPRKNQQETLQRQASYQTIVQKSPNQFQLQNIYATQEQRTNFTPQKLKYENKQIHSQSIEQRTTAIISPRLHQQSVYMESTMDGEKPWPHESFQKVENATATIAVISLMLILTGVLNSGLCLYMVTDMRRSYYLDLGIISGFASAALGAMGFRSRQCYWLPNRNYISGYVLVTIFSLLNCCGLVALLGLNPIPGTPFHDLITGVVLALSSLIVLLISLGVITSKWCIAPPPDNRVDVF